MVLLGRFGAGGQISHVHMSRPSARRNVETRDALLSVSRMRLANVVSTGIRRNALTPRFALADHLARVDTRIHGE